MVSQITQNPFGASLIETWDVLKSVCNIPGAYCSVWFNRNMGCIEIILIRRADTCNKV